MVEKLSIWWKNCLYGGKLSIWWKPVYGGNLSIVETFYIGDFDNFGTQDNILKVFKNNFCCGKTVYGGNLFMVETCLWWKPVSGV